jgi:uncharacterized protein (DUF111 family)
VVSVKLGVQGQRVMNVHPEYEDCKRLAAAAGVPVKNVFMAAETAYSNLAAAGT